MVRVRLDYEICLNSGLHIGTGLGVPGLIDRLTVRDGAGLPLVPGSSLKGRLRWQCGRLLEPLGLPLCRAYEALVGGEWCRVDPCPLCRLFGSPLRAGGLTFSDATLSLPPPVHGHLSRQLAFVQAGVKIDRRWRTAANEHLYSHERTEPGLLFNGQVQGWLTVRDAGEYTEDYAALPPELGLLVTGMILTTQVGGGRSRGWGQATLRPLRLEVIKGHQLRALDAVGIGQLVKASDYWQEVTSCYVDVYADA